jgi:hypothetical protein
MQMLLAQSAVWRAVVLFAGMLMGKVIPDGQGLPLARNRGLVCWSPGARSRREDELARIEQLQSR